MDLILKERDIKTLKEEKDGWTYSIKTKSKIIIRGHEIATKEEAIAQVTLQCSKILQAMLCK